MFNNQITFQRNISIFILSVATLFSSKGQSSLIQSSPAALIAQADSISKTASFSEVAKLYEQAITVLKGKEEFTTLSQAYLKYSRLCAKHLQLTEGIEVTKEGIRITKQLKSEKFTTLADLNGLLSYFYKNQGDSELSLRYTLRKKYYTEATTEEHIGVQFSRLYQGVGIAYRDTDHLDSARYWFIQAKKLLDECEKCSPDEVIPARVSLTDHLSHFYSMIGHLEKALGLVKETINITTEHFGKNHPQLISLYFTLCLFIWQFLRAGSR